MTVPVMIGSGREPCGKSWYFRAQISDSGQEMFSDMSGTLCQEIRCFLDSH